MFKIDLIVWKLLSIVVISKTQSKFKIDLIVWKPPSTADYDGTTFGLKLT